MINIKSENVKDGIELRIEIKGEGRDIADEAFYIMRELPKRLKKTSMAVYFHFLSRLIESGESGVAPFPDQENENEINSEQ